MTALDDMIARRATQTPPGGVTRHDLDQIDTDLGILARDLGVDLTDRDQATAAVFGAVVAPVAVATARDTAVHAIGIAGHLLAARAEKAKGGGDG